MKLSASVTINRPIDIVFDLTNEHVAEWSNFVVSDEPIETTEEGIGSTFRRIIEEEGHRSEGNGTVTAFDPPNHSAVHMVWYHANIDTVFQFEKVSDNQTRVTQHLKITFKGLHKIMFICLLWVLAGIMRKNDRKRIQDELESLKAFCESYEEE